MAEGESAGCVRPTAAAAIEENTTAAEDTQVSMPVKKEHKMIHVGHKAPDFAAPGFANGAFVTNVRLSDYLGQWVVLCFYPGDFTFV